MHIGISSYQINFVFDFRLKAAERVLGGLNELSHIAGDFEQSLCAHTTLSSENNVLNGTYREIQVLVNCYCINNVLNGTYKELHIVNCFYIFVMRTAIHSLLSNCYEFSTNLFLGMSLTME